MKTLKKLAIIALVISGQALIADQKDMSNLKTIERRIYTADLAQLNKDKKALADYTTSKAKDVRKRATRLLEAVNKQIPMQEDILREQEFNRMRQERSEMQQLSDVEKRLAILSMKKTADEVNIENLDEVRWAIENIKRTGEQSPDLADEAEQYINEIAAKIPALSDVKLQ